MPNTSRLNPLDTLHLEKGNHPAMPQRQRVVAPFTTATTPWRIILYIGVETVQPLTAVVDTTLMVGRADATEGFTPAIDLGPHGAQDAGVSRRHATIFATDNGVHIRDLGSTNGTRINGFALEPQQAYKLREGDRVEFGHLQLVVQITRTGK